MSRIKKTFAELKKRGEAALIPFITAGDPDLETTLKILRALDAGGADCIELGIPFFRSNRGWADDSTLFRARAQAGGVFAGGFSLGAYVSPVVAGAGGSVRLFQSAFSLRPGALRLPSRGVGRGRRAVRGSAARRERRAKTVDRRSRIGLDFFAFADERRRSDRVGRPRQPRFRLLCFGDRRDRRAPFLRRYLAVRKSTGCAERLLSRLGVGFGISTPQQAAWIAGFADAAVVGSALVERIEKTKGNNKKAKKAGAFVAQLKQALRQVARSH